MSRAEALDLPVLVPLSLARRALDLSESQAYGLIGQDALPVPVLRVGGRWKVRRADLLRYLGISEPTSAGSGDAA